jgi:integrase/recombinase XerD
MKGGNEFSTRKMSANAEAWIVKLHQSLVLKDYGKGTLRDYVQEMILLFKYCNDKNVEDIRQEDVERYLLYIKEVHKVGRAK